MTYRALTELDPNTRVSQQETLSTSIQQSKTIQQPEDTTSYDLGNDFNDFFQNNEYNIS